MILDRMNKMNRIGRLWFGTIQSILFILSQHKEVWNG